MNEKANEWTLLEFGIGQVSLDGCEVEMGSENAGGVVLPGHLYHGNLLTAVSAVSPATKATKVQEGISCSRIY